MLKLTRRTRRLLAFAMAAMLMGGAQGALAEGEVIMQDPGGSYGDALRSVMYDNFEKETGIDVITVQEARSGPRIKAQVEAGKAEWDLTFIFDQETKLLGDCCLADIDYDKLSDTAKETLATMPDNRVSRRCWARQCQLMRVWWSVSRSLMGVCFSKIVF